MSIRPFSVGPGYRYFLHSVPRGDLGSLDGAPRSHAAESGTPPGRFLGTGLAGLADGAGVIEGSIVDEAMLRRLHGHLQDPVTGNPLGTLPRRPSARTGETAPPRSVAGFDLTFSVSKSVSAVWAIADEQVHAEIYRVHLDAIAAAMRWAEQHVFSSRSGRDSLIREDVRGVVTTAFDHWVSRSGDPHLHTHVVVANRAQLVRNAAWRALDSRRLFKYVVTLSELHQGVLQDLLTERLGFAWEPRVRRHGSAPGYEIAGVPDDLTRAFSRRSAQIDDATNDLVTAFATRRGRQPSSVEVLRLRQQATLRTRPDKHHRALPEHSLEWRDRARSLVGSDTVGWVDRLRAQAALPAQRSVDVEERMLRDSGARALHEIASARSTFSHANLLAEVHRQLHGTRFATPADRLAVADLSATLALETAVPDAPAQPRAGVRSTRTQRYTTREVLAAKTQLLAAARDTGGPWLPTAAANAVIAGEPAENRHHLSREQAGTVHTIVGSGRVLDLLAGPAGSGRDTTLAAVRAVWEHGHGPGSVTGLAPSTAAGHALADKLRIRVDDTATWLAEQPGNAERRAQLGGLADKLRACSGPATAHARNVQREIGTLQDEHERWAVQRGQLVVIDDAALAATLTLDAIVTEVRAAGGKVLLVGDRSGLGVIEAAGAFAMLVEDRGDCPAPTGRVNPEPDRNAGTRVLAGIRHGARTAGPLLVPGTWRRHPGTASIPHEVGR